MADACIYSIGEKKTDYKGNQRTGKESGVREMWKVILWIIGKKRENLSRAIKFRGENYIVSIHKFISAEKELSEWKSALDESQEQISDKAVQKEYRYDYYTGKKSEHVKHPDGTEEMIVFMD